VKSKNEIRSGILGLAGRNSGKELLESIPWEEMSSQIGEALRALLSGRNLLRRAYRAHLAKSSQKNRKQGMTFALDGRLVGDIGELIAAEIFSLDLLGTTTKNIDAVTTDPLERKVQVKATFQADGLSIKHGGDYFIGLQLNDAGKFRVIYNGPAAPVMNYLQAPKAEGHVGRKNAGITLEPISLEAWALLNLAVTDSERIPRRNQVQLRD
jgi:hypothetical protein